MNLPGALPRARTALRVTYVRSQPRPIARISSASITSKANLRQTRTTAAAAATPIGGNFRTTTTATTSSPLVPLQTSRHYASAPSSSSSEPLNKTPLYDLHLAHGAKMVPFGGFHMPVQYASLGVAASHHFTRSHASLFDVGHMVQHRFSGPGAAGFLQRVTPGSIAALPRHGSTLSALLWPGTGGIVDDTIITKLDRDDLYYVVTNAACRDKDLAYLGEELRKWRAEDGGANAEIVHETLDGWGLIALQGPLSEAILAEVVAEPEEARRLRELYFGQSRFMRIKGVEADRPVLVSRGGYTGEDGFEISIAPADTAAVAEALLAAGGPERLQLAGLGARDSLRLEAGMCLYGHDLDDATTPAEAALGWIVGRDRRATADVARGAFHGAGVVLGQLAPRSKGGQGVGRRRVGLVVEGAPARERAEILDAGGNKVGVVTSGCPSPTLGRNIAMGYVKDGLHKAGTEVEVSVRGRKRKAVVTKMPFVPSKYWKGTAPA